MTLSRNINWNLLYTFVVIAEMQGLSRAARVLGRGQPAISAALKKLETQVGVTLIERGSHFFRLTSSGRMLYREALEICGAIDRISVLLADTDEELAGIVRLTTASRMTSPVIDLALAEFHRRYPRATISSTVMNTPELLLALSNKLIHFGIAPAFEHRADFAYKHIFKEYCAFYCGVGHPLYGRTDLKISDLRDQGAIAYQTAVHSDALHSISTMTKEIGFAQPYVGVANTLDELRRMVAAGLGVGAIPVQIAARDVRDGRLWRLPPFDDVMPIDVYLIMNQKVRPSLSELAFLNVLRESIDNTPIELRTYNNNNTVDFVL
ncbi:MAG: LysR family transcriptional regulator [Aliihoeflea sp.]